MFAGWTVVSVSVALVAPETVAPLASALPLNCHWYDSEPVPVAATVNVAVVPAAAFWLCGAVEITCA